MLAVQGYSQPPDTLHLNPSSGSGTSLFADATMRYPAGPGNGDFVLISIGGWTPGCVFMIRPNDNLIYVLQNDASSWGTGAVLGSSVTLQNDVCSGWVGGAGKEVWYQSNGWYERGYVAITLKPGFTGSNPGWTGMYAYSGNSNSTSGWVTTGTWTVPVQEQIIGYVKESPATLNPGEVGMSKVTLSQAGQNLDTMALRVYNGNDPVTFRVRFGRPNQQVWVTRFVIVPEGAPSAGTNYISTVCGPDNGQMNQGLQFAVFGGQYGACYLGMTDASGFLEWTGRIWYSTAPQTYGQYVSGMISAQFHIGTYAFNPNFPGITDGPMNEADYVGALVYWVIGTDGYQGPAPY